MIWDTVKKEHVYPEIVITDLPTAKAEPTINAPQIDISLIVGHGIKSFLANKPPARSACHVRKRTISRIA